MTFDLTSSDRPLDGQPVPAGMEEELRRERERFYFALEAADLVAWDWDPVTDQVVRSRNAERVLGLPSGSAHGGGAQFFSRIHAEDLERVRRALRSAFAQGAEYEEEFRIVRPDGTIVWVADRGRVTFADGGKPHGISGVLRDITAQKRAEGERREAETILRLAQQAGGIGIFDWDLATRTATGSPVFFEIFGTAPDGGRISTEAWERLVHPDDRERMADHLRRALAGSEPITTDYRIVRPDGEVRWINYSGQVVHGPQGAPVRVLGAVLDITARKVAEEALREADRRKDEFLATLAHELRNPLAPVRNAVQILRLQGPPDPGARWARDVIERQVQQLTRLVDDLLDVSRITRGKLELRRERAELPAVLERALETSRPLLEAAEHRLTVTFPERPLAVQVDVTRLAQVISNLLNNAAKYTRPGGHVHLTAGEADGDAVIEVRDDGIGLEPEMLERIFEMFTQVDTSLERAQGGLGIGLTIARHLVEMHGGTLGVASDGPGRGSTFTVRIPLAAAEPVPVPEVGQAAEAPPGSLRILVVDDNRDSAESLAVWLQLMGHDVRTAHGGPEALAAAASFAPEVALLDIGMPGMNGYDLARHLRDAAGVRCPVLVAMTGWGQEEDRRRSREAGFDEHLVKPLDPEKLHGLLARLMQ